MKYSTYRIWKAVVIVIVAFLVSWGTLHGNAWLPVPVALAAGFILIITRRAVRETVADERNYNNANRASRMSFQWGVLAMVIVGATLAALGRGDYPELMNVSYALLFSSAGLVVIYVVAYYIINAKTSGTER